MKQQQTIYRNWGFDFNRAADESDLQRVGLTCASAGGVLMVEDHLAIRQSIMMILSTIPGERVMRPRFGCDIHKLMFSPNDETTAGLAVYYVTKALNRWEKRIILQTVDAGPKPDDPGILEITLTYRIKILDMIDRDKNSDMDDRLSYLFNLSGKEN